MRTMKKAVCLLTAAAMTALLFGCARETESATEVVAAVSLTETAMPEVTEAVTAETAETAALTEETVPAEETTGQTEPEAPATEQEADGSPAEPEEEADEPSADAEQPSAEPSRTPVTAHVHSWQHRTTASTCTAAGYTTHTCYCGTTEVDSPTDPTGHSWSPWKTVVEATQTADGRVKRVCSACGTSQSRTLDKLPADHTHIYTVTVTKEASCSETGEKTYLCSCGDSYQEETSRLFHSYVSRQERPTCTERGYTEYTCSVCGRNYRDSYVNEKGHNWGQWEEIASGGRQRSCLVCGKQETDRAAHTHQYAVYYTKEPCCLEEGYTQYLCTGCKATYIDDYTEKQPHNYTVTVVEPTAYSQGYTQYLCMECCGDKHYHIDGRSFCNTMYTTDYTPALTEDTEECDHDFVEITAWGPTCHNEGVQKLLCETCGFFYTETVPGYTEHEWVINAGFTSEPTCAEDGAEGYWCIHCKLPKPDDIIPALGHDYTATVVAPTRTDRGYTEFTCSVCGDSFRDNYTEAAEGSPVSHIHSYRADVTEPKCSDWGYTTYTCDCGHSYVGNYLPAAGCRIVDTVVAPTETSRGYTEHTCTVCGNSYRDTFTDPVAPEKPEEEVHTHSYTATVTEPSCKEAGFTTHSCVCGDSYQDTWTEATGHSWSNWAVTLEPTEDTEGREERFCAGCGERESTQIPMLAHVHSYTATVKDPTCVNKGYTTHRCACGDSFRDSWVEAPGHNWDPWQVEQEATETTAGYRYRSCAVCKIRIGEEIPVLAHSHSYTATVTEPTCTEDGYTTHSCACGDSYTADRTEASGHSYIHRTVKPTCTTQGYKLHTCSKCQYSYSDSTVEANGHTWGGWETVKAPTEFENGQERRICIICGDAETNTTDKLAHSHNFRITVDYREATCQSEGYHTLACACGETTTQTLQAEHNWVRYHEDEVGHYDVRIVCHCGWSCSAEGNYIAAFADHVAGIDKETRYDHSYYDTAQWVVDSPARAWEACGTCGMEK